MNGSFSGYIVSRIKKRLSNDRLCKARRARREAAMTVAPKLSEAQFSRQVMDLALVLGWSFVHFRPAQTQRGWRTPVQGPLGKGWPDLFLARQRDHRVMVAELKSDTGKVTDEQRDVLNLLAWCGLEWHIWRPADFDAIAEILR